MQRNRFSLLVAFAMGIASSPSTAQADEMKTRLAADKAACSAKAPCDALTADIVGLGAEGVAEAANLLSDKNWNVRAAALNSFKKFGSSAQSATPLLCRMLAKDSNPWELIAAISATEARDKDTIACLTRALNLKGGADYAALALGKAGVSAKSAVPELAALTRLEPAQARWPNIMAAYYPVLALGMMGPDAETAAPDLIRLLDQAAKFGKGSEIWDLHERTREALFWLGTKEATKAAGDVMDAQFNQCTGRTFRGVPIVAGLCGYNSRIDERSVYRITTPEAWVELWSRHGGSPKALPAVDFSKNMVIAYFDGRGGYGNCAVSRIYEGKDELRVGFSCGHSDALTLPGYSIYLFTILPRITKPLVVEEDSFQAMSAVPQPTHHVLKTFAALDEALSPHIPDPSQGPRDFDRPGFWNKVYLIPGHREGYKIRLKVASAPVSALELRRFMERHHATPALVHAAGMIGWSGTRGSGQTIWPRPNDFFWEASTAEAAGIVSELSGLGEVLSSRHVDNPVPNLPELAVKRDGLENAAALLSDKIRQLPATVGLLDAERTAIRPYLDDAAWAPSHSLIYVVLLDSTTSKYPDPDVEPVSSQLPLDRHPSGALNLLDPAGEYTLLWARLGIGDSCHGKPQPIQIDLEEGPGVQKKSESILLAHGAVRDGTKCMPDIVNGIHYADILSRTGYQMTLKQLDAARPEVTKVSRLVRWEDANYQNWEKTYASVAERREKLRKELSDNTDLFEEAPVLRSLVRDEITRLSAPAKVYESTKKMAFVEIIVLKKPQTK